MFQILVATLPYCYLVLNVFFYVKFFYDLDWNDYEIWNKAEEPAGGS